MKKILIIPVFFVLFLNVLFSNELEMFLSSFFENNPGAVSVELEWQNCRDNYNASLLNAGSKMDIIQADIVRYEGFEEYIGQKWDIALSLIKTLLDMKKITLERNIADTEYKMYSEDLTNKQKALNYGGVSSEQVDMALVERDYGFKVLEYYKTLYTQTRKYLLESLYVSSIPEVFVYISSAPSVSAEDMAEIKGRVNFLKKISLQQELENARYKMASAGVTTSYLAEYSRNKAKVYELKGKSAEQDLYFQLSTKSEKMKLSFAKYEYATEKKAIKLDSMKKLQEAYEKGYITSIEYYRGVLELYEFDRQMLSAEEEFIMNYIDFLRLSETDPEEGILLFLDGRKI